MLYLHMPHARNGFSACSPRSARLILIVTGVLVAFCIGVTQSPLKSGFADAPPRGTSDVQLYQAVCEQVHENHGYYLVNNHELRSRGYPTGSVFNWRAPVLFWLLGSFPNLIWGHLLITGLAGLAMIWTFDLLFRERGMRAACCGGLLLAGAFLPCVIGELFVMPEVWAGTLILLSLLALARKDIAWGIFFGIAATFIRELALPYTVLGFLYAVFHRQWRESAGWLVGIVLFGLFYAWHIEQVQQWIRTGDVVHQEGWFRLGGTAFVISTVQMNVFLLLLPQWVAAIYFPLSLLGFASWRTKTGEPLGLAIAGFVVMFAIIGQPFNQYWGSLIAPLFCLGAGQAPLAIRELWNATKISPASNAQPLVA